MLLSPESVKRFLADREITQATLADASGMLPHRMSEWLNGKRDINLSTADKIFDAMSALSSPKIAKSYTYANSKKTKKPR